MKNQRKKQKILSFIAMLTTAAAVVSIFVTREITMQSNDTKVVSAAGMDVSQYTKNNPLTVVEVVPYMLYAEFGNHIAGGGILDYELMESCQETNSAPNNVGPVYVLNGDGVTYTSFQVDNRTLYAIYSKEYFKRYSLEMDMVDEDMLKKQAIRKRLTEAVADSSEEQSFKTACQNLLDTTYAYTSKEESALKAFNSVVVEYRAVLISEVNENPSILNDADLLLITGLSSSYSVYSHRPFLKSEYKEKLLQYNPMDEASYNSTSTNDYESQMAANPFYYDEDQRLSWESASHIFELSAKIGGLPVIMHNSVVRSSMDETKYIDLNKTYLDSKTGERKALTSTISSQPVSNSNVYKLYLMLYEKGAIAFKEDYYRYINDKGEYTLQSGDAKSYWGLRTFVDFDESGNEIYEQGDYLTSFNNILISNGFTYNNDASPTYLYTTKGNMDISVTDGLTTSNGSYIKPTFKYQTDVGDIFEEGTTTISIADAIKYLLMANKTQSYEKTVLHVLEIEPSNEFTLTEDILSSYFNGYTGDFVIEHVTSRELNGTRCDLAGQYDLIYLGANIGGLSNEHNDTAYDSLIYMAEGDSLLLSNGETKHYSGNDINDEVKEQLSAYIKAGLPFIIADGLDDTLKMENSSNMYGFVHTYLSDDTYQSQMAEETSFQTMQATAEARLLPYLNHKRPDVEINKESYNSESLAVTLDISGIDSETQETATISLYADLDSDGIIDTDVAAKTTISEDKTVTVTVNGKAVEQAANALIYKVVVTLSDGDEYYSTVFGTTSRTNTKSHTVKLLQITPEDTTIDLSSTADLVGKKLAGQSEYAVDITTVSVEEYELFFEKDAGNLPYDKDNVLTDQLVNYDVVLLGCSADYPVIDNENGAVDNLLAFIDRGKSVIFTYSVLSGTAYPNEKTKKAYQSLRLLAGIKESDHTYAYLNKNKKKTSKYSMFDFGKAGLNNESSYMTTAVTKLNEGAVTQYPYKIEFSSFTELTAENGPEKVLNQITAAKTQAGMDQAAEDVAAYLALGNTDKAGRLLYSVSPNDCGNNYYLYNKEKLWYMGIGATLLVNENEEAELLVNTIIQAFAQAGQSPSVEFMDVHTESSGDSVAFLDADVFSSKITQDKTLTFIPYDPEEYPNGITTSIYVVADGITYPVTTVKKADSDKEITLSKTALDSGTSYELTIDKDLLNCKEVSVYITVKTEGGLGATTCKVKRRNEFNLD